MLEYIGLSGGSMSDTVDAVGSAFSELADATWFWPGAGVMVGLVILALRRGR